MSSFIFHFLIFHILILFVTWFSLFLFLNSPSPLSRHSKAIPVLNPAVIGGNLILMSVVLGLAFVSIIFFFFYMIILDDFYGHFYDILLTCLSIFLLIMALIFAYFLYFVFFFLISINLGFVLRIYASNLKLLLLLLLGLF